ncbi:MAG: phytanoyl-CoA dioxygenase family protein [Planctomycetota bacterium]|nr:phytanoyl-CoA dioxygenase family protein [Planctomycetota bacterium]
MAFEFTDAHIQEYFQLGYTVFRAIIPPALLRDLRRETDKGRVIARQRAGENAQRLQPIAGCPELDMKPFDDYHALPPLVDALNRLLGPSIGGLVDTHATRDVFGVLYEPAGAPWCTQWHRDWRDNIRGLKVGEWEKVMLDFRLFNQINCALYDDSCTWVVPGSHLRKDTPGEIRRFPDRPVLGPTIPKDSTPEETEVACLAYTMSMPGAVQAHLNAGDYLLYRNSLWHIGNYVPYRKRATIHDGIFTPEFRAFFTKPPMNPPAADGAPAGWENPNLDSLVRKALKREPVGANA